MRDKISTELMLKLSTLAVLTAVVLSNTSLLLPKIILLVVIYAVVLSIEVPEVAEIEEFFSDRDNQIKIGGLVLLTLFVLNFGVIQNTSLNALSDATSPNMRVEDTGEGYAVYNSQQVCAEAVVQYKYNGQQNRIDVLVPGNSGVEAPIAQSSTNVVIEETSEAQNCPTDNVIPQYTTSSSLTHDGRLLTIKVRNQGAFCIEGSVEAEATTELFVKGAENPRDNSTVRRDFKLEGGELKEYELRAYDFEVETWKEWEADKIIDYAITSDAQNCE